MWEAVSRGELAPLAAALEGVRYMVVTMRDGLVVEPKGCADRRVALSYAADS